MQDVVVPDFHRRMRRGELIINPFSAYEEKITSGGGSLELSRISPPGLNDSYHGSFSGSSITQFIGRMYNVGWKLPTISIPDRSADAKANALQAILAPKARLMEDLLELRQTIATLGNPLRSVSDVAREISRKRVTDGAAKAWLAYAMELRPLYQSLCDLHEGLMHQGGKFTAGTRLRATGISFTDASGSKVHSEGGPPVTYTTTLNVHTKWRAVVYYRIKQPVKIDLQQYLGLRARDIPTGIWNTVGYSFLVDRVANISRSLNALMNLTDPNVVIEGGCISVDTHRVETAQVTSIGSASDLGRSVSGDIWTKTSRLRTRGFWQPSVVDVIPPVNIGGLVDTTTKVLDLAALAQQALRRVTPRRNQLLLSKDISVKGRKVRLYAAVDLKSKRR
jgi:hypothetical protein